MKLKGSRRGGRGWNAEKESEGWAWNSSSPFVFIINMSMEGRYLWEKRPLTWSSEEVLADWACPRHNNIKGLCPFNNLHQAFWICTHRAFKSSFIPYGCAGLVRRNTLERRAWIRFGPGVSWTWTTPCYRTALPQQSRTATPCGFCLIIQMQHDVSLKQELLAFVNTCPSDIQRGIMQNPEPSNTIFWPEAAQKAFPGTCMHQTTSSTVTN